MPCYKPLDGWFSHKRNENGKHYVVFKRQEANVERPVRVACGRCIGCRLERSRQAAMKCMYEEAEHKESSFITLTFNDKYLPYPPSIDGEDLRLFWKRFRKNTGKKIRYFACGEYGEKLSRPHYHAIVFGHDFLYDDPNHENTPISEVKPKTLKAGVIPRGKSAQGDTYYSSEELEKLWPYGNNTVAPVTFETCAYVARYVVKKITGEQAKDHYVHINPENGEILPLMPEFVRQSKHLGKAQFERYKKDFEKGYVTLRGKRMQIPKTFDKLLMEEGNQVYSRVKAKRTRAMKKQYHDPEHGMDRLRIKEEIKTIRTKQLKRELSND